MARSKTKRNIFQESQHRALVTPAKRGKGNQAKVSDEQQTSAERRASMTWAQRLKRVFNIDIEICQTCGGPVRIIACIEDPVVVQMVLAHLKEKVALVEFNSLPESRRLGTPVPLAASCRFASSANGCFWFSTRPLESIRRMLPMSAIRTRAFSRRHPVLSSAGVFSPAIQTSGSSSMLASVMFREEPRNTD